MRRSGRGFQGHADSDGEVFSNSKRGMRQSAGSSSLLDVGDNRGRHSDQNVLFPGSLRNGSVKKKGLGGARNRSMHSLTNQDEDDDYIVGPESNLSSIKKKPIGGMRHNFAEDDD